MDLSEFQALLTPAGQQVLLAAQALAPREADYLAHYTALSRRFPAGLSRAALEIAILRGEAAAKFPFAEKLYFTRPALEQATSYPISTYRAGRLAAFSPLFDLGCSVGGDTVALAGNPAPSMRGTARLQVTGIDMDPLRLAMARANLESLGLEARAACLQADLRQALPIAIPPNAALFFDPARREQSGAGRRAFSVRHYQPPLSVVQRWLHHCPALAVKISPGVDLAELAGLENTPGGPPEVEFISLGGELKEAVLWFGPLKTAPRRATLLERGSAASAGAIHILSGLPDDVPGAEPLPLSEPQAYLYEPDPAVIRAGLVGTLGRRLGAAQLDPDIAYLTAPDLQSTPFARAWAIETWLPFSLKRLRTALRERHVGRATVKKRGSPLEPQQLIHDLRLQGSEERIVFLTHLQGRPIAIITPGG
jgi:SAM-dependent methyltransferase